MTYFFKIAGVASKYKSIDFVKRHPSPDCDTFSAVIEWNKAVNLFDRVSILKDATILFEGFVESINCFWDETQRYKKIEGRCRKVILWKKFIERYERGDLDGFFGAVNASKLARFLLRCPISDDPSSSVFHRIGYGFDLNDGKCSAVDRDRKTHPEWCRVRHSGFCWRLNGCNFIDNRIASGYTQDAFVIDGCTRQREWIHSSDTVVPLDSYEQDYCVDGRSDPWEEDDWTQVGPTDPWLDNCPNDDANYISVPVTEVAPVQSYFTFQDLPAMDDFKADRSACQICLRGRLYSGGDGCCDYIDVRVWLWDFSLNNCAGGWVEIGDAQFTSCDSWETVCLDIPAAFWNCQDKRSVNECRLKVRKQASACGAGDRGGIDINWARLHIEGDEVHWNDTANQLAVCNEDVNYIEAYQTCDWDSYWDFQDVPLDHCLDTLGNTRDWRELSSINVRLFLDGRNIHTAGAGRAVNVRAYLWDGSAWHDVGSDHIWAVGETTYTLKNVDVSGILDSIAKINAARLRLWFRATGTGTDADWSHPRITCAYLEVNIQETDYQRLCDWFDVDLGALKSRVMGVLVESRYSNDKYARNYEIQTSPDKIIWTTRAGPFTNNQCRDILESWSPVDNVRYVRIHITAPADEGWEISQVFVWQAEDPDYDIEGITIGDVGSANFEDYGCDPPISATSFGFQRLSEAVSHICEVANAAYIPWEWWIEHNAAHDFHFEDRRGVDRSGTIHIQKGVHIKSVDVKRSSRGTVQRDRYLGRGEGKGQDEIASDWQVNAAGIAAVNTFYEKVISEKSVGNKAQADALANVYQTIFGAERIEVIVELSYDPWEGTANHYEVGDEVFFTDVTCGFDEEKLRIVAIERSITNEPSNTTILTLATSWYDVADLWADINRELRNLGLTGTVNADWRAEGGHQDQQSAQSVEDVWSAQAKNDEINPPSETDDDRWETNTACVGGAAGFVCDKDVFLIKGCKDAGFTRHIHVWLLRDEDVANGWINFDQNPRFVMEIKIPVDGADPADPTEWHEDDYVTLGMLSGHAGAVGLGFGFRITKVSGGYDLETFFRDSVPPEQTVYLQDLAINTKYRLEARVDWDERLVKWYVNNTLTAILPFDATEGGNNTNLHPFNIIMTNTSNDPVTQWDWLYIYSYRAQAIWES